MDSFPKKEEERPEYSYDTFDSHWLYVEELVEILKTLPLDYRAYPNHCHNIVLYRETGDKLEFVGYLDFGNGVPYLDNDEE